MQDKQIQMDVTTPPKKTCFQTTCQSPKALRAKSRSAGHWCRILLHPSVATLDLQRIFAFDVLFCRSFWVESFAFQVARGTWTRGSCTNEARRHESSEYKDSQIIIWINLIFNLVLNYLKHFGVLQSFARHKSSWTWIREHNLWKNIWRVSFRIVEFDCRPLEEEDRQDLIEGLKTKWEQAPRMMFVGDICPLKPDEIRNGQWKGPQSGTRWCIQVYSNRFQSSRHWESFRDD